MENQPQQAPKWVLKIYEKRLIIAVSFFLFLFAAFMAYRYVPMFQKKQGSHYVSMDLAYQDWKEDPSEKRWKEFYGLAKKNPYLFQKYEPIIAQDLLNKGINEERDHWGYNCMERLSKNFPLYGSFSKATLLISQKDHAKALEEAKLLKKEIDSKDLQTSHFFLYAYNLLRIASLENLLKDQKAEIVAYEELKHLLKQEAKEKDAFLESFSKRHHISLEQYFQHREGLLISKQ